MSPVPLAAMAAGVAGSVALEAVTSGGKMSQRDTAIAVGIGLIPGVGLGMKGALRVGQKIGTAASMAVKSKKLKELKMIGQAATLPGTRVYLGRDARLFVLGGVANVALGHAYDKVAPRGGQRTIVSTTRMSRTGDGPSILSQRTSRSPRFGKKRRRCRHRNKAGKRCLRPAGHSGRHRYR